MSESAKFVLLINFCDRTEKCGDGAPEAADLYFSYGKALLENAISQTAVLGKEEAEEAILKDQNEEAGKPAFVAFTFAS